MKTLAERNVRIFNINNKILNTLKSTVFSVKYSDNNNEDVLIEDLFVNGFSASYEEMIESIRFLGE